MNANHSFLHRVFPEQMEILLITMGPSGCLLLSRSKKVQITTIPAPSYQTLISASGTGDCFNAAFLTSLLNGANLDGCMQSGQKAASLSLQSSETVPDTITYDSVIKPYL
jgi:sugar/nucleoside kinase (ribokinase family)